MLALSKADLVTDEQVREAVAQWQQRLGPGVPVLATSSATGYGVRALAELLLASVPRDEPAQEARGATGNGAHGEVAVRRTSAGDVAELAEHMVFRPADSGGGFLVQRVGERAFEVSGEGIERLIARHDVDNEDAMAYVEERLRRLGVLGALQDAGFVAGRRCADRGDRLRARPGCTHVGSVR